MRPALAFLRLDELEPKLGNLDEVVLDAGCAVAGTLFAGEADLLRGFVKVPSLVPGRVRLPFLLKLEPGRSGGPIGLSTGLKKLDLRRSLGVVGMLCKLSMVLSDNEGLDPSRPRDSGGAFGNSASSGEPSGGDSTTLE